MKQFGLYKKDKLCARLAIDSLFAHADISSLSYPVRMVARHNARRHSDAPVAFLISIPKKRLRHAVDRVLMRRRIREAFRLNRHQYHFDGRARYDVAFIYVADRPVDYAHTERAICRLLDALSQHNPAVVAAD